MLKLMLGMLIRAINGKIPGKSFVIEFFRRACTLGRVHIDRITIFKMKTLNTAVKAFVLEESASIFSSSN